MAKCYSNWMKLSFLLLSILCLVITIFLPGWRDEIRAEGYDSGPPTLAPKANQTVLWPPNHKMVDITINANARDDNEVKSISATVHSDEPENGLGDGDKAPDWTEPIIDQTTGIITLQLRAERSAEENGRTYSISITATDSANKKNTAYVHITVPHDNHVEAVQPMIAISGSHIVGLRSDGTVAASGNNDYGQLNVESWTDIIQIAAGSYHTVGLKSNGTVVVTGSDYYVPNMIIHIGSLTNIVQIAADGPVTTFLRHDGTATSTGDPYYMNIPFFDEDRKWIDLVQVDTLTALKSDGTALYYCSDMGCPATWAAINREMNSWSDIVQVSGTVGLKSDGTVVVAGYNDSIKTEMSSWSDIIQISKTVGLKSDGTVIAAGYNDSIKTKVSAWSDIVQIAAGSQEIAGLKSDGTVVSTKNFYDWNLNTDVGPVIDTDTETDTDSDNSTITETDTDSDNSTITETDTDSDNSTITETDTGSDNSTITETDTDSDNSTITETDTGSDNSTITETDTSSDNSTTTEPEDTELKLADLAGNYGLTSFDIMVVVPGMGPMNFTSDKNGGN